MRQLAVLLGLLALVPTVAVVPAAAVPLSLEPANGTRFTVLQMNLCLSGQADCYPDTAYPAILDEATSQILDDDADAVTLNEACSRDAAEVARRTGYQLRFAAVFVEGAPLRCVHPGSRGHFGIAVLTKARLTTTADQAFATQTGAEQRRWICATTSRAVTVCTAHLSTRGSADDRHANDGQCAELEAVLARYTQGGITVFGGDLNRRASCAPDTMWATADTAAAQVPGIQHIYGSTSGDEPYRRVDPALHTDHDFFLVASRLPSAPRG